MRQPKLPTKAASSIVAKEPNLTRVLTGEVPPSTTLIQKNKLHALDSEPQSSDPVDITRIDCREPRVGLLSSEV